MWTPRPVVTNPPLGAAEAQQFGLELRPVAYGPFEFWPAESQAFLDGKRLSLTRREYQLLEILAALGGHVVEKERLRRAEWGNTAAPPTRDRAVDVHVAKLRRKLEAAAPGRRFIHTHFGMGYRLEPEDDAPAA